MTAPQQRGYAVVHQLYADLGWTGVIKLKNETKFPPPTGFTGNAGAYPSAADRHAWADEEALGNTAIRLHEGFIGIDEDRWNGKTGQQTIAEAEKRWGPLPASLKSTSRTDGSGIRIYRVPAGIRFVDRIEFPEIGIGDVEIIQPHHRYAMVWPSQHPNGPVYYWHDDGGAVTTPPHVDEIPELPAEWVEGLREPEPATATGSTTDGGLGGADTPYEVRLALTEGEPSHRVAAKLGEAIVACQGGSRHDTIRNHVLGLLRCGKQGDTGVLPALAALKKVFVAAVAADRAGGHDEASTEFDKFVFSKKTAQLLADATYDEWAETPGADTEFGTTEEPGAGTNPLEGAVQQKLQMLRINREAQRRLEEELHPPAELPPVKSLDALLAEPDQPSQYRIKDLAPLDGRVLFSAQYKAGKTTLVSNLLRSLADNTPFLGYFDISTPASRIALVDDELSENMLRSWLREQEIGNTAAVVDTVSLRGKLTTFNPMDDRNRAQWAARWRDLGVEYLVLDCLRPVLDAHGLDENRDAGTFLVAFDALMEEAGVRDSLTLHHMGHANERSRGDSRLQDWPDAIWRVMRETEEPDSDRYFSAFGRDVNVPEGRLTFEPATRRLTYTGGNRTDARIDKARLDVIELLVGAAAKGAKPNGTAIENQLVPPHTQKSLRQAVGALVRAGLVAVDDGPRNSKLHYIAHPCDECRLPVVTGRARHESCPKSVEELVLQ